MFAWGAQAASSGLPEASAVVRMQCTDVCYHERIFVGMSTQELNNPHDRFFREAFSRKELAAGFVREYLPVKFAGLIDIGSLEIVKDSYVDKELRQHYSDIVYKVKIDGKPSYLYLLFEHKSYVDPLVGFQLLRNMVKIWETYLKQERKARRLPLVVPLVIYHGQRKWQGDGRLGDLFEVDSAFRQYIPDFDAEVYDISHIPDQAIRGEVIGRALLLLLKYVQSPELLHSIPKIFELFDGLANSTRTTEYLELFFRYLMGTVESSKKEALVRQVAKTMKKGGQIMPSILEQAMREGVEKGIEEGMEKGMEKGIEKGKLDIAEKMIDMGMPTADIIRITGLSSRRIASLRKKR